MFSMSAVKKLKSTVLFLSGLIARATNTYGTMTILAPFTGNEALGMEVYLSLNSTASGTALNHTSIAIFKLWILASRLSAYSGCCAGSANIRGHLSGGMSSIVDSYLWNCCSWNLPSCSCSWNIRLRMRRTRRRALAFSRGICGACLFLSIIAKSHPNGCSPGCCEDISFSANGSGPFWVKI